VKNLQNDYVVAFNCSIEDSRLKAGLVIASSLVDKEQILIDQDTGVRYRVELPDELVAQGMPSALDGVELLLL
jgi:hypothetical protein